MVRTGSSSEQQSMGRALPPQPVMGETAAPEEDNMNNNSMIPTSATPSEYVA
jgi:hypothetical protein